MTVVATLAVNLVADCKNYVNNITQSREATSKFAKGTSELIGQVVGITSVVSLAAAGIKIFKESIAAAAEEETNLASLNATIQSMGLSAVLNGKGIRSMAEEMQAANGIFAHDDLEKAAQSLLRIEGFDSSKLKETLAIVEDFAAGTGRGVAEAGQVLANVLETGQARALGFSAALRTQLQDMVAAGDKAGALALIMETLNTKYGGQAAAALDTYNGKVATLKNNWGEVLATVGNTSLWGGKGAVDLANKTVVAYNQLLQIQNYYGKVVLVNLAKGMISYEHWLGVTADKTKYLAGATKDSTDEMINFHKSIVKGGDDFSNFIKRTSDYGNQLASINSYGQMYMQGLKDMKPLQDDLAQAQLNYNRAVMDTENLQWLKSGLVRAQEKVDSLTLSEGDLTEAQRELEEAQRAYDDALGNSVGLTGAKKKLEAAKQAVEDLQKAQDLQTASWMLNIMTQQLSADGLSEKEMDFLLKYQEDTGLLSKEGAQRAKDAWKHAQDMANALNSIPTHIDVMVDYWEQMNELRPSMPGVVMPTSIWQPPIPNAIGGNWLVERPTLFLAGEAGPEQATFTPVGSPSGGGSKKKEIHFHDDAQLVIQVQNGQTIDEVLDEIMDKLR